MFPLQALQEDRTKQISSPFKCFFGIHDVIIPANMEIIHSNSCLPLFYLELNQLSLMFAFELYCLHFFLILNKKRPFCKPVLLIILGRLATENTKPSIDKKP